MDIKKNPNCELDIVYTIEKQKAYIGKFTIAQLR